MEKRKTNKALRIALVIAIIACFCASFVGATFAKYVTFDEATNTARAANWGVSITISNKDDTGLFKTTYVTDDTTYSDAISNSVETATTGQNKVAPGTKNEEGITFSIAGTPEVATAIDINLTVNSDVFLGDYTPVKFTLEQTAKSDDTVAFTKTTGTLDDIKTALEAWNAESYASAAPNTDLGTTFKLTWVWAFDSTEDADIDDVKDTKLGDLAAGVYEDETTGTYTADSEGTNWSVDIDFKLDITVTQIN